MDDTLRQRWFEAISNGATVRNMGCLRRWSRFCPLGILCELHRLETGGPNWHSLKDGRYSYFGSSSFLPVQVRRWANLDEADPMLGSQSIATYNDATRVSMTRIAELVARYL